MSTLIGLLEKSRLRELGPQSQVDVQARSRVETRISSPVRAFTTRTLMKFTGATAT